MDKYYKYPNFVGAKIHGDYSQSPTASAKVTAIFEEIAKRGKPIKIHNSGPGWEQAIVTLAKKHRDLTIIIAHGGGRGLGEIVKDTPNVYMEYCGSSSTRGLIREHLDAVGDGRLMYG